MKINSTVALTLTLLSLMFGAGIVSAAWGLVVGREALKGITQPDTRPANPATQSTPRKEEVAILREDELIKAAKARMKGALGDRANQAETNTNPTVKDATKVNKITPAQVVLPISTQTYGVFLEVASVSRQGNNVVIKVNMKNSGKGSVRFLYDGFLNVKDNNGDLLTTTTQGLPDDLPATGELFSGTVSIPAELVETVDKVSLSVSDYPDQRIQLQLSNIPVTR